VVIDPWNAVARDDKARDHLQTFDTIREVIPPGDQSPALCIVAHTRKPKSDERPSGRALLHEIAGSHVIVSVARSAFVMQHASDDPEQSCVIWNCCKNNDGQLPSRSAWNRRNGLFEQVTDFDWDSFDSQRKTSAPPISTDDVRAVFAGSKKLTRSEAQRELQAHTGRGRSSCYTAIKQCESHLQKIDGKLSWND
jgi:hypothetical protein